MHLMQQLSVSSALLAFCIACSSSDAREDEPVADASSGAGAGAGGSVDGRTSGSDAVSLDASTSGSDASAFDASTSDASTSDMNTSDSSALDAASLECRGALPLQCGDRLSHSTDIQGQPDLWSGYNITARAESGRETVYAFRTDARCEVVMRLTELDTDLDLFVLDECDPISCTEVSSTPLDLQTHEGVLFRAEAQRDYVVAVDGYSHSSGSYSLSVDCFCGDAELGLSGGEWSLQVDRRWNGESVVAQPSTPLPEEDYEPVSDGPSYKIIVPTDWQGVWLGDEASPCELTAISEGKLHYELTTGTFAGGRLVIWAGTSGLQAERTMYGSGVPIASSERGALIRAPMP